MGVRLKVPGNGAVVEVADGSASRYEAAGWVRVDAPDAPKPAKKSTAKKSSK